MRSRLLSFFQQQSFQPGLTGILVNPFFLIRSNLFRHIRFFGTTLHGKLLDFGCGRKPYRNLFPGVTEYIGVDIEQHTGHNHSLSQVDVFYDGKTIPFANETFDSVFCSEVLEHVFTLDSILTELNRVLKKDGKMLLTVPFCWNEHEVPYDFGRYTSYGLKYLLEQHGFSIIELKKSGHFLSVQYQLLSLYIYEALKFLRPRWLHYLIAMLFIAPIHLIALIFITILPKNKSLYFNNIVLAQKNRSTKSY